MLPTGFAANSYKEPFRADVDPSTAIFGLLRSTIETYDLRSPQSARETDKEDRPIPHASQCLRDNAEHRYNVLRKERLLFDWRSTERALDAGEHVHDVAVVPIERCPTGAIRSCNRREPSLDC